MVAQVVIALISFLDMPFYDDFQRSIADILRAHRFSRAHRLRLKGYARALRTAMPVYDACRPLYSTMRDGRCRRQNIHGRQLRISAATLSLRPFICQHGHTAEIFSGRLNIATC